jgi:hypothetical protein
LNFSFFVWFVIRNSVSKVILASAIFLLVGCGSIREIDYTDVSVPTEVQIPTTGASEPTLSNSSEKEQLSATSDLQLGESAEATFDLWSLVELSFSGPNSTGLSSEKNPFKLDLEVSFISPRGEEFLVPGFYQGNGEGGMDGNVWQVRFAPDEVGKWSYSTKSSDDLLNGQVGTLEVIQPKSCLDYHLNELPNFECLGRLNYTGQHYLQFAEGPFWLKGGVDEPEDFLAPDVSAGFPSKDEAIDFLADHGVNSIYLLLQNVDGDGQNVWPWFGSNQAEAKKHNEYFDLQKLREWERVFDLILNKGIVLHLVLEDDSGWTGFNREMYYREMVARFAHHNGLIWNISEEYNENYSPSEISQFAKMLRDLDPYDHPITVHHAGRTNQWEPFLNDPNIDLTSFQTGPRPQNEQAVHWFELVSAANKIIPISFDETGQLDAGQRELAREIIWSVYLGGANYELFTRLKSGYPEFELLFEDLLRARNFIEQLPFESMMPCNELLQPQTGYCFGKLGEALIIYFPEGGTLSIDLSSMAGKVEAHWFDPRTGETFPVNQIEGEKIQSFSAPDMKDWILKVTTQ